MLKLEPTFPNQCECGIKNVINIDKETFKGEVRTN